MASAILMGLRLLALAMLAASPRKLDKAKAHPGLLTSIITLTFDVAVIVALLKYISI